MCSPLRWKASERNLGGLMTPSKTWHSHISTVEPIMPHQKGWTPSGLCVNVRISPWGGRVLQLSQLGKEGHWHDEKYTIPPPQYLLLIVFLIKPQLVAKQRFICHGYPLVITPSAPEPFPCTLPAKLLCFWKQLIELLTINISVSQPQNSLFPAVHNFSSKSWELHLAQLQNKVETNPCAWRYSWVFFWIRQCFLRSEYFLLHKEVVATLSSYYVCGHTLPLSKVSQVVSFKAGKSPTGFGCWNFIESQLLLF